MQKIQRTIDIKAPVQRVYDFINQPNNLPGIWPNMVSVSNVVAEAGGAHHFDWVFKMVGVHFKGHAKVEEAQSGKFVRVRNESGIPSTFVWTYTGLDGSGTRLSLSVEYTCPAQCSARSPRCSPRRSTSATSTTCSQSQGRDGARHGRRDRRGPRALTTRSELYARRRRGRNQPCRRSHAAWPRALLISRCRPPGSRRSSASRTN